MARPQASTSRCELKTSSSQPQAKELLCFTLCTGSCLGWWMVMVIKIANHNYNCFILFLVCAWACAFHKEWWKRVQSKCFFRLLMYAFDCMEIYFEWFGYGCMYLILLIHVSFIRVFSQFNDFKNGSFMLFQSLTGLSQLCNLWLFHRQREPERTVTQLLSIPFDPLELPRLHEAIAIIFHPNGMLFFLSVCVIVWDA